MSELDIEEREWKMAQIRADIANKEADTDFKRSAARSEPYKMMAAMVGATAAIFGTLFGILGYILGRGH